MFLFRTLLLAVGLGMDAMSVSMAIGVRWHGPRQKFRLAWHMGLFQCAMPILGWWAGKALAGVLEGLSVATSIDALLAGQSLGIAGGAIVVPSLIIGVVAGVMALAGVAVGKRLGRALGRPAEILGAIILMGLAVSFLWR